MWSWIVSNPWTTGIVVVVGLGAIGGLIVAIATKGRWVDRGFMERDGKPLKWPHDAFPVTIIYHEDVSLAWRSAIRVALLRFETAVGRRLFEEFADQAGLASYRWDRPPPITSSLVAVMVKPSSGVLQPDNAVTEHRYDTRTGVILAAEVVFPDGSADLHVATHEIGHVLGLDHDEMTSSIMFHKLSGRMDPGTLSPQDAKRLKEAYGAR
jgi:hypothetical protein